MDSLQFVQRLDATRVVMLNSGRFDGMLIESPDAARQVLPQAWVSGRTFQVPFVCLNTSGADINHDGTVFPAGALALHIGAGGEPAVLRLAAPADGEYRVGKGRIVLNSLLVRENLDAPITWPNGSCAICCASEESPGGTQPSAASR